MAQSLHRESRRLTLHSGGDALEGMLNLISGSKYALDPLDLEEGKLSSPLPGLIRCKQVPFYDC